MASNATQSAGYYRPEEDVYRATAMGIITTSCTEPLRSDHLLGRTRIDRKPDNSNK
jgi:hypothetical protein